MQCFALRLSALGLLALLGSANGCSNREPQARAHLIGERVPARPTAVPGAAPPLSAGSAAPRHVILVIGDGMQLAHEIATSRYLFGWDDGLSFHKFPRRFFKTTWDVNVYNARAAQLGKEKYSPENADPLLGYDPARGGPAPYPLSPDTPEHRAYFIGGPYPDSASTATAMSTGKKTDSSNIAWEAGDEPDGVLETAPAALRRLYGMSMGLVTTVPISHATPGAFFAHNRSRNAYWEIAKEILVETRPEVVIGGVQGHVDEADVERARARGDWVFVERQPGVDGAIAVLGGALTAVREKKGLMGLFGNAAGNFESPVPKNAPGAPEVTRGNTENPRLADAARAALEVLATNPRGFFLLVEQGDIDWANHEDDFARMIGCVWDLHTAVEEIVAFIDRPGDAIDWDNTTVMVTADHANSYLRLERPLGVGVLPRQEGKGPDAYPDGDVSYGATSFGGALGHTSELVTLYARGHAADAFDAYATAYPGLPIVDDTAVHEVTLVAAEPSSTSDVE